MLNPTRRIITGTPLVAVPALAADGGMQTGITSVGPATFLFTIAGAMLLALVFRSVANHVAHFITGKVGEFRIRRALSKRSPDVLHDFILPGAYGGLAKIDHAILTAGGILCIQSKHFNGIVFGGEDEAQWTNIDGVHRQRFLNPLIQNEGRTRALQKVVPDVPVENLVIFTGSVELNTCLVPARSKTGTLPGLPLTPRCCAMQIRARTSQRRSASASRSSHALS
jgi:hypothetical protein